MAKNCSSLIEVENFLNGITAAYTIRDGGNSEGPYKGFNLGLHVGDDEHIVLKNRQILEKSVHKSIVWMNQTHSDKVVLCDYRNAQSAKSMLRGTEAVSLGVEADGIVTNDRNVALAVLTADCLPLLMASEDKKVIAAVHCGWKGLKSGIVKNAVTLMRRCSLSNIHAYIGPCIGPKSFEVGQEVLDLFSENFSHAKEAFVSKDNGKYLCSLPLLCSQALTECGVNNIVFSDEDTYSDEKYYSYRRANVTGRMASIISIN